jgi:hypothetical protein
MLFENRDGEFYPTEKLPESAIEGHSFESALFLDYNNDGWQDLLLLPRHDSPVFLQNNGGEYIVKNVGLNSTLGVPIGASAADYTGNGCLDIFIFQNGDWTDRKPAGMDETYHGGQVVGVENDNGNRNLLYRGDCTGFENATNSSNISGQRWTLSASFVDLTNDGWPDIHVANDYNHDYIYVNQRDGTFKQVRLDNVTNRNGMASEVADINNDGRFDIFVTNIFINRSKYNFTEREQNFMLGQFGERLSGNNLLINQGNGDFEGRAPEYNVSEGGWGWAASIADFDNDGSLEIFHTTETLDRYYQETTRTSYYMYPVYYERRGSEFVLRDPEKLGFQRSNGRGTARLDFDRDGQLDLVIAEYAVGENYKLYRNDGTLGSSVKFTVRGWSNQTAIGANVYLKTENKTYHRVKSSRSDFLSQDSRVIHIGLKKKSVIESVRVVWPDGTEREFEKIEKDNHYVVSPNNITGVNDW